MTGIQQRFGQMASDESGAAGDEHTHKLIVPFNPLL
jgi:hypothetical protein